MATQGAKVLLMGRAGAGKTSMRSIIFANYLARETSRLHPTNNVENSDLRFLGNLHLNLWDCGGQDVFMENYFESQRDHIFRNVAVLIWVCGSAAEKDENQQKELTYFGNCMDSIRSLSPQAKVFVLVHKLDLVYPDEERIKVFETYKNLILDRSKDSDVTCFPTSIWDETLFAAWSTIVNALIPNIQFLNEQMAHFCRVCDADEVVLFEKATFLVITHSTRTNFNDEHRFEKISNIIKQFKLSCGKSSNTNFRSLSIRNSSFCAFIELFTQNTFIMVIVRDSEIYPTATTVNIDAARQHFQKIADQSNSAHL